MNTTNDKSTSEKPLTCNCCGDSQSHSVALNDGWYVLKNKFEPWDVLCGYCANNFEAAIAKD